jgi:CheY-like chemotaxis protein
MADPVVLIVDDNDDNRFTLSMRLEACAYENIVTAENGREVLEKMRQGPVDLVLLDIMMPELDGYGVLEELRTDTALRDIPVVMISALEDINSVVRCIELGATDYLTKPLNPVLLKARVDNCIEKARYKAQEAAHLARIESEKRRADELLTTVLPRSIACALAMVPATQTVRADWAVRIGIDFGPVSAGIMGKRQFQFDVWGDTVNTAARIEEYGRPGSVNVSGRAWLQLRNRAQGRSLGFVDLKGKEKTEVVECVGLRE